VTVTDLSCPTGDNYAAIALQLQETALETESRLIDLEQRLRAAVNRPTILQVSTTARTGLVLNLEGSIGPAGFASFTTVFNNTGLDDNIDDAGQTMTQWLGDGLYEIGLYANLTASGAVNDNTYRLFTIAIDTVDPTVLTGFRRRLKSELTLYETNTGVGTDGVVTLEARLTGQDQIKFLARHGNTSSSMNAPAGVWVWLSKVSTADAVVVV
jgi:hypothetical protein